MTSSRFPIGVAQTASGTAGPTPPRRSPRTRGDPRRSGPRRSRARPARAGGPLWRGPSASRRATSRAGSKRKLAAAVPKPPPTITSSGPKVFTSDPMPAPRRRPIEASAAIASASPPCARSTSCSAFAPSPHSSTAARSAAFPDATDSRWPRPVQLPWHGGPSATTTVWPSSAQPRKSRPARTTPPPTPVPSVSMIRSSTSRPAPRFHSPSAAAFASFCTAVGSPNRSSNTCRRFTSSSGMLIEPSATPVRASITDGTPNPRPPTSSVRTASTAAASPSTSSSWEPVGVGTSCRSWTCPSRSSSPARIFVPPRSTPMTRCESTGRLRSVPSRSRMIGRDRGHSRPPPNVRERC